MRWHKLLWVEEELMQKHSQDLTDSHLKIISLSFDLSFTGLRMQSNSIFQLGIAVLKKLFTLWCWEKTFWTVQLKLFICGEGTCINKWTNQQMLVINHLSKLRVLQQHGKVQVSVRTSKKCRGGGNVMEFQVKTSADILHRSAHTSDRWTGAGGVHEHSWTVPPRGAC